MKRQTVWVLPSSEMIDPAIRDALERIEPVRFVSGADVGQCGQGDALITFSADAALARRIAGRGLHWLHVTDAEWGTRPAAAGDRVRFATSRRVDRRLRGRSLAHRPLARVSGVRTESGDEVLAWYGREPVWVARPAAGGWVSVVSLPLPRLGPDEALSDFLDGERFIEVLPWLHFLRQASGHLGHDKPPMRACLMFDDPNLHRPSYGFLLYEELARRAKAGGFHVALATVPLDAWAAHPRAVAVFRDHPEQLSLLIHGNDHLKAELGRARSPEATRRLVAQALRRISRLERATGLAVARVMAPPHGAYSDESFAAMLSLGFEGACISRGSLRRWSPRRQWPPAFGLGPAEMMGGFPVIPRFGLSASCEGAMVMAAFLDRPIIAVGHHDSVAGGLELLSDVAGTVNSLGDVRWMSPERMLRSNYLGRRQNGTLWVTPYASRLQVTVPPDVTELVVEAEGAGEPVTVAPGDQVEVVSSQLGTVDFRDVQRPGWSAWALPRRLLCEGRDRLQPFVSRVARRESAP